MSIKKVLILIPYENIYPPLNGGMQRCFHILHQLSKHFEVTAIMHQHSGDFLKAQNEYPDLKKIKVFSTGEYQVKKDVFSFFPKKIQFALRYRWLKKNWKGPADSDFLKYYYLFRYLLKKNQYDLVVLENLATLKVTGMIRHYQENAFIVYDVHNVDTNLAMETLDKGLVGQAAMKAIMKAESTLYKTVDGIIVCSDKDLDSFKQLNKGKLTAAVIPNAVQLYGKMQDETVKSDHPGNIIFCGSLGYGPNIEGLIWFYKSIWPLILYNMPDLKLLVVGSGKAPNELDPLKNDKSVLFTGMVPDVKKYYNKAAIAIVPLKSGSGTRLKILEAMSLGVPVISTSKGAEGINYLNRKDIIIADEAESFAAEIIKLLLNRDERILIKDNAETLIREQYDWDIIGNKMQQFLVKEIFN